MSLMIWLAIAIPLALLLGFLAGYLLAVHRVARTVAAMDGDELKALESRVELERARHLSIPELGVLLAWRAGELVAKEPPKP